MENITILYWFDRYITEPCPVARKLIRVAAIKFLSMDDALLFLDKCILWHEKRYLELINDIEKAGI